MADKIKKPSDTKTSVSGDKGTAGGKLRKTGGRPKREVGTPFHLAVACDHLLGVGIDQSAANLECGRSTIQRYRKDNELWMKCAIDKGSFRRVLRQLFPTFVNSVLRNMAIGDSAVTIAYGKGMGHFIDTEVVLDEDVDDRELDDDIKSLVARGNQRIAKGAKAASRQKAKKTGPRRK